MKLGAVPGGDTRLFVTFVAGQYPVGFTEDFVGTFVASSSDRFWLGYCIWDRAGIYTFARAIFLDHKP